MNVQKIQTPRLAFLVADYFFCLIIAFLCMFPLIHILAMSFSSTPAVNAGIVGLVPVDFNVKAYQYVMQNFQFFLSYWISIKRVVLGLVINMLMTILAAYPLSKSRRQFRGRQVYVWYFIVTMLFSGGLIPSYLAVNATGLLNKIWALVIPGAVPVGNVILMQNFMKALPDEISESAFVDGAGHWRTLRSIILPLCAPSIAAISLFCIVGHWNEWFSGILYMNSNTLYPLQSYLRTLIIDAQIDFSIDPENLANKTAQAANQAAQMFLAMIPVLIIYPFVQKHFTTGIVMGSVKG
jgi:putative aldouronate transport system permease protein